MIGGHPYIDVRTSFNSFLPDGLEPVVGEKLVDSWLDRLDHHPELHDKVEFEVASTIYDFTFATDFPSRYPGVLSSSETAHFSQCLQRLTNRCLDLSAKESLAKALETIRGLAKEREERPDGDFSDREPMQILGRAVAAALAAGNAVVLKPAEDASLSALVFAQIAHQAGLPPGALNVVTGLGAEVGQIKKRNPGVPMCSPCLDQKHPPMCSPCPDRGPPAHWKGQLKEEIRDLPPQSPWPCLHRVSRGPLGRQLRRRNHRGSR